MRSNKDSKVFIYFANHGANGLLAFPNLEYLFANDFAEALKTMHKKGLYGEMVIYMEGSNSGSMFEDILPDNIKIYGLSASESRETGFATYCFPDDVINGEHIGTCLGDVFSANLIEEAEKSDISKMTIEQLTKRVKSLTKEFSAVNAFGDNSFNQEPIGNFISNSDLEFPSTPEDNPVGYSHSILHQLLHPYQSTYLQAPQVSSRTYNKHGSAINARDAKIHYLMSRLTMLRAKQDPDETDQIRIHKLSLSLTMELHRRMRIDHVFEEFLSKSAPIPPHSSPNVPPKNFMCLKRMMDVYEKSCGNKMDEYELQYVNIFVQECEKLPVPSAIDGLIHRL